MKTWSFWSNESRDTVTGSEGDGPPLCASGIQDSDCTEKLYLIQAATYEEAMSIHYLRMGWAPYKPMGESRNCPKCESIYYPEGSGMCWKCNNANG